MYAQSTTFFLYGTPCASMCVHACKLATVRDVHACAVHATERLCCFFSPSWKIGRGKNGELPLCFLFVLRVCTMDHHGRNCCGLSRDVAWRFRLSGWCAMCFARRRYPTTTDVGKGDFCYLQVRRRPSGGLISKTEKTSVAKSSSETPQKDRLSLDPSSPEISRCTDTHTVKVLWTLVGCRPS